MAKIHNDWTSNNVTNKVSTHPHVLHPVGEPIRLVLEHKGVDYEDKVADRAAMKTDLDTFHFGQVPV